MQQQPMGWWPIGLGVNFKIFSSRSVIRTLSPPYVLSYFLFLLLQSLYSYRVWLGSCNLQLGCSHEVPDVPDDAFDFT